jgi:dTDP-glucose pyrophosphorylase/CBS domain-containing protein
MRDLSAFLVGPDFTIRQIMECIDKNAKGIALVTTHDGRLIGTLTDGDLRRALLGGLELDTLVGALIYGRGSDGLRSPVTALANTPQVELLAQMNKHSVRHIPLVDETGKVVDLVFLADLVKDYELPLRAVVMAGGFGTRLRPLTDDIPKPMLAVGDKPLLEHIIEQLRQSGIRRVNLTTHYKADMISGHFGDGADFGVEIRYLTEHQPLGTAGALSMVPESDEPLLVMNGDILTRIDFRSMLDFHREQKADMTVAVRCHEFKIPYGVVETDGVTIRTIREKPIIRKFVNAGIYLLNPQVCRYIPHGGRYDMPELIERLLRDGRMVVGFAVREYWLDIGQLDDYRQANVDVSAGKV